MAAEIIIQATKFAIEWAGSLARHRQMEKIASELSDVSSKIDVVQQQLGQLILREVRAAFDALEDAQRTTNVGTAMARLRFAEDSFLKNTRLDPGVMFGGVKPTIIMAMAHQGLAAICALRHDDEMAERHLLRLFMVDPRLARTELNPGLYDALFLPKCEDIYEDYNRRDSERRLRDERRASTGLTGWSGAPALIRGVVLGLDLTVQFSDIIGGTLDRVRREAAIDQRCRKIAAELLGIDEPPLATP
jgi:hypothetical protein